MNTEYAIYVTSGVKAYDSSFEWGGCHITLAGFNSYHNNEEKLANISLISKKSLKGKKAWTPGDYTIEKWKGKWTLVLTDSHTLDKVCNLLKNEKFKKIKGPKESGTKFHITLPHVKSKKEAQSFADSLKKKEWFITVAKKNEDKFQWVKYYPLGKC